MRAKIWGCRGSLASPGPATVRYGGNTSCVEIRLSSGELVILDAGTGMLPLGSEIDLTGVERVHLLLTHLHLDHIQGLGFFPPLWDPNISMVIWGPASPTENLETRLSRYLSPPLFPLQISGISSRVEFRDVPVASFDVGGATVTANPVSHSGPTVGYRIEDAGVSMTYIPDHEPAHGKDLDDVDAEWISGFFLAHKTDLLLHDSQYTEDEYPKYIGWGHSSVRHAVTFAQKAEVKKLLLFHHDPTHSDAALESLLVRAKNLWGSSNGNSPTLAFEGMEIDVGSELPAPAV